MVIALKPRNEKFKTKSESEAIILKLWYWELKYDIFLSRRVTCFPGIRSRRSSEKLNFRKEDSCIVLKACLYLTHVYSIQQYLPSSLYYLHSYLHGYIFILYSVAYSVHIRFSITIRHSTTLQANILTFLY